MRLVVVAVLFLTAASTVLAQHTPSEFGASFAYGGQYPFIADGNANFFTTASLWNIRAQLATNYIQSYSAVLERIGQTSTRQGLWSPGSGFVNSITAYNADISEHLALYALYVETNRTIVRTDKFRVGLGLCFGYALGSADASVKSITEKTTKTYDGDAPWTSFYFSIFSRARLTVYETRKLDIALTGTLRYWGLPTLGPLAVSANNYNGPNIRALHELGYLGGISVGVKSWK